VKRRTFIKGLGSAAAWPLAAAAQQGGIPVIGYLDVGAPDGSVMLAGFRKGLSQMGYVEDRNIAIEYR
jgi:putative tryptophan/tyrosine transport system substrate-binding protein